MANIEGSQSSSSGDVENLTIAYTESVHDSSSSVGSGDSSLTFSSSYSSESTSTGGSAKSAIAALDRAMDKERFFGYNPVWRSMSLTDGSKVLALQYLFDHSVFKLLSFLMNHLLANTPEAPITYLLTLVEHCIKYRDGDGDPPLLFEDSHILSVFCALDPAGDGAVTYSQYLAGMNTLGLTEFNILPNGLDRHTTDVSKDVFVIEAKRALMDQLDLILGKTRQITPIESEESQSNISISTETEQKSSSLDITTSGMQCENTNISLTKCFLTSKNKYNGSLESKKRQWRPSKISFKNKPSDLSSEAYDPK